MILDGRVYARWPCCRFAHWSFLEPSPALKKVTAERELQKMLWQFTREKIYYSKRVFSVISFSTYINTFRSPIWLVPACLVHNCCYFTCPLMEGYFWQVFRYSVLIGVDSCRVSGVGLVCNSWWKSISNLLSIGVDCLTCADWDRLILLIF